MFARDRVLSRSSSIIVLALIAWLAPAAGGAETVIIGDLTFANKALVGVGRLPSDLRDKFGETFGSGSAIAVDPKSWVRTPAGYQGTFYMLPDRGYNVIGTSDYRARINQALHHLHAARRPDGRAGRTAPKQRHGDADRHHPAHRRGGTSAHRTRSRWHPLGGERFAGSAAGVERPREHR